MEDYPSNTRELAKEIAAFATSNPGTISLGVDDDKKIVGVAIILNDPAKGKDEVINRVAGLCQNGVKPAIVNTVEFIDVDSTTVVVKLNIPKGIEPVYYCNNIPYIRNLTSSTPATPEQVKELHRQYFQGTFKSSETDEKQSLFGEVLNQLSDFQIMWSDYDKRQVNPDLEQLKYDLGSTGRGLIQLSVDLHLMKSGLSDELIDLAERLEDMERHQFYLDGGISWNSFVAKGNDASTVNQRLIQRVLKNYRIYPDQYPSVKAAIVTTVREFNLTWKRRQQYIDNRSLSTLKEALRRLAFAFNRFANLPLKSQEFFDENALKRIAINLREASAFDYRASFGANPLGSIEPKVDEAIKLGIAIADKTLEDHDLEL